MINHVSSEQPLSSPSPAAPAEKSPKSPWHSVIRYWPTLVVGIVVILLAGLYQFTVNQFNTQITADHAQHGKTSPHVHTIVHVRQKLLVGVSLNNPPFSFKPAGELVGFDIDLGKAIARELNVPVEFVEYKFADSLSSTGLGDSNPLTEDKVDIVIGGITVNRNRQQYYAFSKPYLSAGLVAVTSTNNTSIQQSADLSGKLLGVLANDPAIDFAKTATAADHIKTYTTRQQAVTAINNGSIEALIIEAPSAQVLLEENQALHIATDLLTQDDYAVMIMRSEDDLVSEIDAKLNLLRQKGVLESLRHKWLE